MSNRKDLAKQARLASQGLFQWKSSPQEFVNCHCSAFFRLIFGVERRLKHGLDLHITQVKGNNHSAHTSKETQEYLNRLPGRLEFVFTPKHGSWLNMIEVVFVFIRQYSCFFSRDTIRLSSLF